MKLLCLTFFMLYFISCSAQSITDTLVYVDTLEFNKLKASYDSVLVINTNLKNKEDSLNNLISYLKDNQDFTPDTIINKVDTSYIKLSNSTNSGYILINRKNPVNYIHIVEGNVRNAITWNGYSHTLQIMVQDSTSTIWNNNYSIDKLINCY